MPTSAESFYRHSTDMYYSWLCRSPLTSQRHSRRAHTHRSLVDTALAWCAQQGPCNGRASVCLSRRSTAAACCGFAAESRAGGRYRSTAVGRRRPAATAPRLTCHIGSHSVTCHPTDVTSPPLHSFISPQNVIAKTE